MVFLYTARSKFDKSHYKEDFSWNRYIEWSKLTHLTELVSLDGMLNEILVEPDYKSEEDWVFIHVFGEYITGFFTTNDYVIKRMKKEVRFNLLAVAIDPEEECKKIAIDGYEFIGYDLLDQQFGISALSNCGGFHETFLPSELNKLGLIDELAKAQSVKNRLMENNPQEHHADTNVIAVWRHKTIGR